MRPKPNLDREVTAVIMQAATLPFKRNEELEENIKTVLREQEEGYMYLIAPEYSFHTSNDLAKVRTAQRENNGNKTELKDSTLIVGMFYQAKDQTNKSKERIKNEAWILTPNNKDGLFTQTKLVSTNDDIVQARIRGSRIIRESKGPYMIDTCNNNLRYKVMFGEDGIVQVQQQTEKNGKLDMLVTLGDNVKFKEDACIRAYINDGGYQLVCNRFIPGFAAVKEGDLMRKLTPEKDNPHPEMCSRYNLLIRDKRD